MSINWNQDIAPTLILNDETGSWVFTRDISCVINTDPLSNFKSKVYLISDPSLPISSPLSPKELMSRLFANYEEVT